jgi:hypothetical protein
MERNRAAGRVVMLQEDRQVPLQILGFLERDVFPNLSNGKDKLDVRVVANSFWGGGIARECMKLVKSMGDSQAPVLRSMLESARIAARQRRQQRAIAAPENAAVVPFGLAAPVSAPVGQEAVGEGGLHNVNPFAPEAIDNLDDFDQQVAEVGGAIRRSSLPERPEDQPLSLDSLDISLIPEMPGLTGQGQGQGQEGPVQDPANGLFGFLRKAALLVANTVMKPVDRIMDYVKKGGSIKKRNNRLDNHKITRSNKKNNDNKSSSVPKTKKIVKLQKKRKFTIKIKPKDALTEPKA